MLETSKTTRKLLIIAGVPIDDLTLPDVLDRVEEFIQSKKPHQIATVNADFVLKAWEDPELRHILNQADILTADGMPLIWGAKLLGVNLQGRVTGADMVPALAERGSKLGWRFFLLGGRPGIAERAAQKLGERYPGFNVVGMYSPPFAPVVELTEEINERIRAAQPDILLVAFGNPKQEKWIYMHGGDLNVPVSIGIGGSLDFAAGEIPRAPLWMQNSGLEWIFRLIQEPGRMWKRYILDMVHFTRFFILQWWRQMIGKRSAALEFNPKPPASSPITPPPPDFNEIPLQGLLTSVECAQVQPQIESALKQAAADGMAGVSLQMSAVRFIDSAGMGMLVNLTKQARALNKQLYLQGLRQEILTTLRMLRLDQFLMVQNGSTPNPPAPTPAPEALHENGWRVLTIPARLESLSARLIPQQLEHDHPGNQNIVADFSQTSFVDSSGIAAILSIQRRLQASGGQLRLAGLNKDVRWVFELSGVARHFTIKETVAEATQDAIQPAQAQKTLKENA